MRTLIIRPLGAITPTVTLTLLGLCRLDALGAARFLSQGSSPVDRLRRELILGNVDRKPDGRRHHAHGDHLGRSPFAIAISLGGLGAEDDGARDEI